MYQQVLLTLFIFLSAVSVGGMVLGEAIKCYHCFDMFSKNRTVTFFDEPGEYTNKFVPCGDDKSKWNVMECPPQWPICIVLSGQVRNSYEISRTCAERNFCSNLTPPNGGRLDTCIECSTSLCNEYPNSPVQPIPPREFNFNVNVQLNVKNCTQTVKEVV